MITFIVVYLAIGTFLTYSMMRTHAKPEDYAFTPINVVTTIVAIVFCPMVVVMLILTRIFKTIIKIVRP